MQAIEIWESLCIAPYFPKEEGFPCWFVMFANIRKFHAKGNSGVKLCLKVVFLINLPDKVFIYCSISGQFCSKLKVMLQLKTALPDN